MAKRNIRDKQNFVSVLSFRNETQTSRQAFYSMKKRGSIVTVKVRGVEYVNLNESGLTARTAKFRRSLEVIAMRGESINFED